MAIWSIQMSHVCNIIIRSGDFFFSNIDRNLIEAVSFGVNLTYKKIGEKSTIIEQLLFQVFSFYHFVTRMCAVLKADYTLALLFYPSVN